MWQRILATGQPINRTLLQKTEYSLSQEMPAAAAAAARKLQIKNTPTNYFTQKKEVYIRKNLLIAKRRLASAMQKSDSPN